MVRKQIVIEAQQERELEVRSRVLGISQSAVIREALDAWLASPVGYGERNRAWDRALGVMHDADRLGTGSGGCTWSRGDLHER